VIIGRLLRPGSLTGFTMGSEPEDTL